DSPQQVRNAIYGIEALVRIHLACGIGVGRYLPTADVDRIQPGLHHLERLVARHRTEGMDIGFLMQQVPESLRADPRERVFNMNRPAQPNYILGGVGSLNTLPPRVVIPIPTQSGCSSIILTVFRRLVEHRGILQYRPREL